MRIIEIRVKVIDRILDTELPGLAEDITDSIYDFCDKDSKTIISDVTYEIRDDYQE